MLAEARGLKGFELLLDRAPYLDGSAEVSTPTGAYTEVDSFLDGVNVERLAALISRQAEQAQFLVVSHRRPMIGASTRTIGVTQARGAHTQVVGLPDAA